MPRHFDDQARRLQRGFRRSLQSPAPLSAHEGVTPTVEARYLTQYREVPSDTPGLVLEDDGTVTLISPDGSRTTLNVSLVPDPTEVTDGYVLTAEGGVSTWAPGGGSQPGTLINGGATSQANGATVDVPMDGATHNVACIVASPPAWMDGAGNIIAAGLYKIGAEITVHTAPTTAHLYAAWESPDLAVVSFNMDGLAVGGEENPFDVVSVVADMLPYAATAEVIGHTDVSGVLAVSPSVQQLASATS